MNHDHEPTLAAIEQLAIAEGIPQGDADAYVADELRVPFDHYVAYQLVWGAIETYRRTYPERSGRLHLVDPDGDTPGAEYAPQLRRLFELAGAIHEAAVNGGGDIRATVRELARDLIGELVDLADVVLASPGHDPATASTSGGRP
ncbi:hypothetical protein [Salsipaludibacter albus]|uniref:hypothetical protein n=1 Tax=Salsipaludibacter albus TaxID=2849650 RepID=UPI001EE45221|nr:hypothetical protein [Salsipaludibacter albus]MBY5161485.1 hypothetical protein [Salsipaludibacter albus]